MAEVLALVEQRAAVDHRGGVREAVAEIEFGRVTAAASESAIGVLSSGEVRVDPARAPVVVAAQ